MNSYDFFISLIKSIINNTDLSDTVKSEASFSLFKDAFIMARKHDLSHLIYYAAEKNSVLPKAKNEQENDFLKYAESVKLNALMRYCRLESEAEHIKRILNKANIEYIFLKGTELRTLYPEPWLRTSGDIDVLIHRNDLSKAIAELKAEGFERKSGIQYHDVSLVYGRVHLELHHNIMVTVNSLDKVLSKVWDYTEDFDVCQKKMNKSFFVFHQIAHTAYHMTHGWCSFRSFIDLWLLETCGYDHDEVNILCEEAGLKAFYERVLELIRVFFADELCSEENKELSNYILGIGEYGKFDSANALKAGNIGRFKRALSYILIPYKDLVVIYPGAKHKALVPYYQVKRWLERIFVQKKSVRAIKHLKKMKNYDQETIDKMSKLRKIAGLENVK